MFQVEEKAMSTQSEYTSGPAGQRQHVANPAYYTQNAGRGSDRWPWVAVALIAAIAAIAVAFIVFLGNKHQTASVRTVAQVAAHQSPAHKVITRTVAGPSTSVIREVPASSSQSSGWSSASGSCGSGISVNADTSCPFAQNVADQYEQQAQQAGAPGSFDVYAYSPATGQNYTDTCGYSPSDGTVSCSHGSDLIQFSYGDVSAPAVGSEPSGSGSGSGSCGAGISINANTSCQFAQSVVAQYMQSAQNSASPGSFAVEAYSPVTGKSYTDSCGYSSSTDTVSCSHGSDLIEFTYGSH
jgi:hypothetical protein